ncbi:MAG TPA: flagellar basal body P-ring protein FlgI [Phycisphaerae bacterium]|nr:flagellar basal body P-ring protein FlgI [Phycisphaerae bacterium]
MRSGRRSGVYVTSCLIALCLSGCSDFDLSGTRDKSATRPAGTMGNADTSTTLQGPAFEGTVGSVVYLQGHQPWRVRGFGLVTGLNGRGGRNCPPSIREQLVKEIRRYRSAHPEMDRALPPAEEVIEHPDTAVVEVTGEIPGGAGKRRRFDLFASAVDPDTKSISGGYLLPCDLRVYSDAGPAGSIAGRVLATAQGPIFTNPFATPTTGAATVNPREGRIIGGGWTLEERKLELISTIESYSTVRQVQDAINRRFPEQKRIADAVSPKSLSLKVPSSYLVKEGRYLEIVLALPLSNSPMVLEGRAKALIGELARPEAPLNKVALAIEGIGVSVLPMLQPLYTHSRMPVNYHAARTGLRLGDELALDVVIRHAQDESSPTRREAILELGRAGQKPRAVAALNKLLGGDNPQIRILAYEALREAAPETVFQVAVGPSGENFTLELVPCEGPPLVYARRTLIRRIALIGGDHMLCKPPMLYTEPGSQVTLSAQEKDSAVTVLRKDANGKLILGPIEAPLAGPSFIRFLGQPMTRSADGKVEGLGLDYAVILDVLYRLSEKKALNAQVRWEEPDIEDLLGPLTPVGRPESEL